MALCFQTQPYRFFFCELEYTYFQRKPYVQEHETHYACRDTTSDHVHNNLLQQWCILIQQTFQNHYFF